MWHLARTKIAPIALGLTAALASTLALAPPGAAAPDRESFAPGDIVWQQEFDGPAGAGPTAPCGATTSAAAAGATPSSRTTRRPQQLRARRAGQPRHHRPARERRAVHLGAAADQRKFELRTAASRRACRSRAARASGRRSGCSATTSPDVVADLRRDRHHGEHRQGAAPHVRHRARPRLLGRRRHHRRLPAPAELAFADAFHTFAVDWKPTPSPGPSTATSSTSHRASVGGNAWVYDNRSSSSSTSPSAASGPATPTARPSSRSR